MAKKKSVDEMTVQELAALTEARKASEGIDKAPRQMLRYEGAYGQDQVVLGDLIPPDCDVTAPDGNIHPAVFLAWGVSVINLETAVRDVHIPALRRYAILRVRMDKRSLRQGIIWTDMHCFLESDLEELHGKSYHGNKRKWRFTPKPGVTLPPVPNLTVAKDATTESLIEELKEKGLFDPMKTRAEREKARLKQATIEWETANAE